MQEKSSFLAFNGSSYKDLSSEVSRYELKKQLQGIQSFDISSFAQSKNPQEKINQLGALFPSVNDPTLQVVQQTVQPVKTKINKNKTTKNQIQKPVQYNIRYLAKQKQANNIQYDGSSSQKSSQQQYYENLTARTRTMNTKNLRNLPQNFDQNHLIRQIGKKYHKLQEKYQFQEQQNLLLKQKIKLLEENNNKMQSQMKFKLKEKREQIKMLKQRQIKVTRQKQQIEKKLQLQIDKKSQYSRQSRTFSSISNGSVVGNTTTNTTLFDDPSVFCPQLLSPQETVVLLKKLLKKVCRSNKMVKQLTGDPRIREILKKIEKP